MFGEHVAVLADPSKPASHGPAPLEHRCAVHEPPAVHLTDISLYKGEQLVQLVPDNIVVVCAPGILCDFRGFLALFSSRKIIQQQRYYGLCPWHQSGRVDPEVEMV